MSVNWDIIHFVARAASKSYSLKDDLCEWLFGMTLTEMLISFRGIPINVEKFRERVTHAAHELIQIAMYINDENPYYQLESHWPSEFDKFDYFIQDIARRSMAKVGRDHNYHLLVPVARAIEEIINAAGGVRQVQAIRARRSIEQEDIAALPFFG